MSQAWSWDLGRIPGAPPLHLPGYRLGEELGHGGMGSVYRAVDEAGRAVAVKVLLRERMTPAGLARFEREAQLLARHRHPNVVTAHAWGVTDRACWLACELVEGVQIDVAGRALPLSGRLDLIEQAARAVGALHAQGVVHRDLKPSNLLVDGAGQVKLIDFGVSTAQGLERLTTTGQFVGTPLYAPPERITGGAGADLPAGDVWALAAIAYEVLTGEHPYPAEEYAQLSRRAVATPTPPRQLEPALPRELARVILRALHPDHRRRPADAQALALALARARARRVPRGWTLLTGLTAFAGAALALGLARPGASQRESPPGSVTSHVAGPAPSPQPVSPQAQEEARAAALLQAGDPHGALAAVGSASSPAALEVRAAALGTLRRWGEVRALLAGREEPALRRWRGLAALFGQPPEEPGEDLEAGDPLRVVETRGRDLLAAQWSSAPELVAALEELLELARACDPGDPGGREVRRRAQERTRELSLGLAQLTDLLAVPAEREVALLRAAAALEEGPARDGLAVTGAWLEFTRRTLSLKDNTVLAIAEMVTRLPAAGGWLDEQPPLVQEIDASLRLVAAWAREGQAPPELLARAEAAVAGPPPRNVAGVHLRRLALRYLAYQARDAACAAWRRGDQATAQREVERARGFVRSLERNLVARVRDKDLLATCTVALLAGDLEAARAAARAVEEHPLRRVLLAECALVAGDLAAAREELGSWTQLPGWLKPYGRRIQLHRRVLARELGKARALSALVRQEEDMRPDMARDLGLEWHTGPGLYDVLSKDGWWPGR